MTDLFTPKYCSLIRNNFGVDLRLNFVRCEQASAPFTIKFSDEASRWVLRKSYLLLASISTKDQRTTLDSISVKGEIVLPINLFTLKVSGHGSETLTINTCVQSSRIKLYKLTTARNVSFSSVLLWWCRSYSRTSVWRSLFGCHLPYTA